jgi:hypothetical protein
MADSAPSTPAFDAGQFRYLVARYLKLLIRARYLHDPGFISRSDLAAWDLSNIGDERQPAWQLVRAAADVLGKLNADYLPVSDSGGIEPLDESTPLSRVMVEVAFFVVQFGGGPYHNQALLNAASMLREGQQVDWPALAAWDRLGVIRADLSRLPHPEGGAGDETPGDAADRPNVFRRTGGSWRVRYDGPTPRRRPSAES